jgi:hypothetical protein
LKTLDRCKRCSVLTGHRNFGQMSFFGRAALVVAVAAGVAHVFRKDLKKIISVLKKPAENFVKDVRKELDTPAPPSISAGVSDAATAAARAANGQAPHAISHPPPLQPPVAPSQQPAVPSPAAGGKSEPELK